MEKFINEIRERLDSIVGEKYEVKVDKVKKNNGCILNGITFREKDIPSGIEPILYAENYYSLYQSGMTVEEIADLILRNREAAMKNIPVNLIANIKTAFLDFSKVKNNVFFKLVNYERNQKLLQEIPYIEFLDLALIFYYQPELDKEKEEPFSVLIRNEHIEKWGVDASTLLDYASVNTPRRYPAQIEDLNTIMMRMIPDEFKDMYSYETNPVKSVYVVTNNDTYLGATVCFFYPGIMKEIYEKISKNFYIIPSSVHECLIMPDKGDINTDEIRAMVQDVNANEVSENEFLSNNVYYYSNGKLVIA